MNLKALIEKRNALLDEMDAMINKATEETRALTDEENTSYDSKKAEVESLGKTIKLAEESRALEKGTIVNDNTDNKDAEIRAFAEYVRSGKIPETRSGEQNFTTGSNGAVIPATIAQMIIKTVKTMCPIFAKATIFHSKGTLKIPVYGLANSTHDITASYGDDFAELTADAGKFTSVDLTGYLIGALSLVGKTLLNSADIDVVNFVVNEMAEKLAYFIEKELLVGTENKCTGALSTATSMVAGSVSAITADNLIDLQAKVKPQFQGNACWTMSTATFTAIRKLKDSNNRYLLQDNVTNEFPYMLLGKPVYISDNMPDIASAAKAVLYGDYSGLAVNIREDVSIQVLTEKYATQHAVGIVGWVELDSKVMDAQRLATLVMSAS